MIAFYLPVIVIQVKWIVSLSIQNNHMRYEQHYSFPLYKWGKAGLQKFICLGFHNMCRDGKPIQICLTETLFQSSQKKPTPNNFVLAHIQHTDNYNVGCVGKCFISVLLMMIGYPNFGCTWPVHTYNLI